MSQRRSPTVWKHSRAAASTCQMVQAPTMSSSYNSSSPPGRARPFTLIRLPYSSGFGLIAVGGAILAAFQNLLSDLVGLSAWWRPAIQMVRSLAIWSMLALMVTSCSSLRVSRRTIS